MNANELRIGNVVIAKRIITFLKADDEVDFCAAPGMPLTICATNIEFITVETSFKNKVFKQAVLIDSIAPIPLTKEIILTCGFEDMGYNLYSYKNLFLNCNDDNFGIEISSNEDSFFSNVRISSLHQLQNLYFSLTGEELEVVI